MTVSAGNKKRPKGSWGIIIIGCLLTPGIIIALFLAENKFKVSFDMFTPKGKYLAQAFVNIRQGRLKSSFQRTKTITTSDGISANLAFDKSNQKVQLLIWDKNDKPYSRATIISRVSKVGQKNTMRHFKMTEHSNGDFRSESLKLAAGGWVLMVSAYDLFNRGNSKFMFHTERPIFLAK